MCAIAARVSGNGGGPGASSQHQPRLFHLDGHCVQLLSSTWRLVWESTAVSRGLITTQLRLRYVVPDVLVHAMSILAVSGGGATGAGVGGGEPEAQQAIIIMSCLHQGTDIHFLHHSAQYLAAVRLVRESTTVSRVQGARLTRYSAALQGLAERHRLALAQSAATRNMEVHNYGCALLLGACVCAMPRFFFNALAEYVYVCVCVHFLWPSVDRAITRAFGGSSTSMSFPCLSPLMTAGPAAVVFDRVWPGRRYMARSQIHGQVAASGTLTKACLRFLHRYAVQQLSWLVEKSAGVSSDSYVKQLQHKILECDRKGPSNASIPLGERCFCFRGWDARLVSVVQWPLPFPLHSACETFFGPPPRLMQRSLLCGNFCAPCPDDEAVLRACRRKHGRAARAQHRHHAGRGGCNLGAGAALLRRYCDPGAAALLSRRLQQLRKVEAQRLY